jgi:hypothetical protein
MLLKDIYSKQFYSSLAEIPGEVIDGFSKPAFIRLIFDKS